MQATGLSSDRREFLRRILSATAVVVTGAGGVTLAASNGSWAKEMKALDEAGARVLLRMTRQLYPHDALGDIYYAQVVEAIDAKAAGDPELLRLIKDGVAELDQAMGVPWLELSDGYQVEVLERLETGPFFQTVRGTTVVALYDNPLVWPNFGYQGSSVEHGGYILRGFQDAGWTGDPSAEASPPAFQG